MRENQNSGQNNRTCEQDTIDSIQDTAMARHDLAGILNIGHTFQQGFEEVSELTDKTRQTAQHQEHGKLVFRE